MRPRGRGFPGFFFFENIGIGVGRACKKKDKRELLKKRTVEKEMRNIPLA